MLSKKHVSHLKASNGGDFLEGVTISPIRNAKASDFVNFQIWNRDARLILHDRA